jgi:hypothetical protein
MAFSFAVTVPNRAINFGVNAACHNIQAHDERQQRLC